MTFDELRAFLSVAEARSFTRASAQLNRSQPAISRRIDQLEAELGLALFERHGREIAMTEAGRALLPHAEAALVAVQDGFAAIRDLSARSDDRLTLAVVGTIADAYLVAALRAFQSEFSTAQVDLRTANSREVANLVRRGEAMIGIRYFTESDARLTARRVGSERLYVTVAADHSFKNETADDLGPFAGDRWLAFPAVPGNAESYSGILERELAASGIAAPQITTIDSLTAQKRLVEAGFGIALMPKRNVQDELAAGSLRIVEVASLAAQLPVYMIRRRGVSRSRSIQALVEHLRDHIPRLLDS